MENARLHAYLRAVLNTPGRWVVIRRSAKTARHGSYKQAVAERKAIFESIKATLQATGVRFEVRGTYILRSL